MPLQRESRKVCNACWRVGVNTGALMDCTVCTKRQLRFELPCKNKTPTETEESTSESCQMSLQQHNSQQKGKKSLKKQAKDSVSFPPFAGTERSK